ncbi:hypothetical protein, partial [Marinovum sp. 1_MG-2023]|uniref:hypothetical protein n=1 Tax=Marinovum sp. 1_MG-2023 TaxID=3062633 RepID=UPI0026E26632
KGPVIAAAVGRRFGLWMHIKASVFDLPIQPAAEADSGLVGCAAIARTGLGHYESVAEAFDALTVVTVVFYYYTEMLRV